MDVRVGLWRKLSAEELMLLNCGVGEDSWESLGLQGDQPVHPKGDQSWLFIGRTYVEPEIPVLWPPDVKSWLIWKDPDAGKDWGQEEKGTTEDEMVGWHHRLNGHGFGWTPGVGDGREAWRAAIHGVAKSRTRLSNWTDGRIRKLVYLTTQNGLTSGFPWKSHCTVGIIYVALSRTLSEIGGKQYNG